MANVNDLRSIVQGVEQAEARGDHVSAERLLRHALALQEPSLGPNHPEVANILNNLAIVCELNGKLSDAEACYRRAYAIATSSLPVNDPFVTTSRENLEQFCTARGIPLTDASAQEPKETAPVASSPAPNALSAFGPAASSAPPPATSSVPRPAASSAPPARSASSVPPPRPVPPPPPQPKAPPAAPNKAAGSPSHRSAAPPSLDDFPLRAASAVPVTPKTISAPAAVRQPSRAPTIAAVLALLVVLLASGWYLMNSDSSRERAASAPSPSPSAAPSLAPSPSPAQPAPAPQPEPTASATAAATATASTAPERVAPPTPAPAAPEPTVPERPAATRTKATVTALTVEVCSSLTRTGAWSCAPASGAKAPGVMYFYTRVASPRDTTIEHRWYRGDTLVQRVPLRIRANPSGFRTYSQNRISADRTGTWKVELRTEDGQLIDEKTFAIR
jgi:DUF2914 family protein/tetratricopeptide repeat protein